MAKAAVSIITPLFNGADYISETINSVIKQSFRDWELIVIDDCSTDGGAGAAKVREFVKLDSRVTLLTLGQNRGSSGARNEGIRRAKGRYVAFLDADDLWDAGFLKEQLDFAGEKKATIIYSSYRRVDEENRKEVLRPFIVPEIVDYKRILKSLPIFPSTALLDISKTGKVYFDERIGSVRDDYVFWLNLLKNKVDYAYGNQKILVSYRMRADSVTANKLEMILPQWNVLRKVEKLPLAWSLYCMSCWMINGLWKYGY